MTDHSHHGHEPHENIDPQTMHNAQQFWHGFTRASMLSAVSVAVILLLLAFFLA